MAGVIEMATLLWKGQFDGGQLNLGLQNAQSQVDGLNNKFGGLSNFMSKTLLGGVLGLSGGLTAMGAAGVKSALDLQSQMRQFQADTGLSVEETDKVKKAVKDMFVSTGKSYSDLTQMATTMHNQLGMGASDIEKYGTGWVKFAKVTKQSNEEAITGIAGIRNAWHLSNDQIQPVLDKLIVSNQKYGLTVNESESALKSLAPAFQAAHMSINQGVAYLDLFKRAGLDSSSATIAFNTALRKVKSPEELQTIITKMQNTKDDSERAKLAMEVFGKQGLTMAAALKPGSQSLADIQKALDNASGATDKASKALANGNITAMLAKLKRSSQDLLESVGEKALPTIQSLVNFISENMPKIQSSMSNAFSIGGKVISLFGDGVKLALDHSKLLIPVLVGVASSMVSLKVVGTVTTLMKAWKESTLIQTIAQEGLNAVLKANPLGVVITIIGLAVTAGVALYENWDKIKAGAEALGKSISAHFNNIKTDISNAWGNAKTKTQDTWDNIKTEVENKVGNIKEDVGSKFGSIKESIAEKWWQIEKNTSVTWGNIKQDINEHGGGIKGLIGTYIDGYKNIWKLGFNAMNTITGGKLGDIINSVKNKMKEIHDTIFGWKEKLQEAWNKVWDLQLPHIKLPHFSVSGSFSLNPPSIPTIGVNWYANGGIFNSPSIVGVGEAGSEAVLPISKLEDILYGTMQKLGYGKGNSSEKVEVHNHFDNLKVEFPNVHDSDEIQDAFQGLSQRMLQQAKTIR